MDVYHTQSRRINLSYRMEFPKSAWQGRTGLNSLALYELSGMFRNERKDLLDGERLDRFGHNPGYLAIIACLDRTVEYTLAMLICEVNMGSFARSVRRDSV